MNNEKYAVYTTERNYMQYMQYLENKGYKWYEGQKATEEEFDSTHPCIYVFEGKILRQSNIYLVDRGYKIITVDQAMSNLLYNIQIFNRALSDEEINGLINDDYPKDALVYSGRYTYGYVQPTFNHTPTTTMTLNDKINEMYFTDEVAQDAANVVKQLGEYEETLDQLSRSVRDHEIKVRDCKRSISDTFDRNDRVKFEKYLKLGKDLLKVLAKHDYIKAGAKLSKDDKGIDVQEYLGSN